MFRVFTDVPSEPFFFSENTTQSNLNPLSVNATKWSNTQTIRRQFADKLLKCVCPFCAVVVKGLNLF